MRYNLEKVKVTMAGSHLRSLVLLAEKARHTEPYWFRQATPDLRMAITVFIERYRMVLTKSWRHGDSHGFTWTMPRPLLLAAHTMAEQTDWLDFISSVELLQLTDKYKTAIDL